jgi:hypothetical protein
METGARRSSDLAVRDACDVEEIVHQAAEMLALPLRDAQRVVAAARVGLRHGDGNTERAQGIPQLVTEHGQEVVLPRALFLRGHTLLPELPARRREPGEHPDESFVFPIEVTRGRVGGHPHGTESLAMGGEGHEERLHETRLVPQGRKAAVGKRHELGGVLIDADTARTGVAGHRPAAFGGEDARERFPPEHVALEQADAGGACVTELERDLGETLQHVARLLGHPRGQIGERTRLGLVVGKPVRSRGELVSDVHLGERARRVGRHQGLIVLKQCGHTYVLRGPTRGDHFRHRGSGRTPASGSRHPSKVRT